MKVDASAFNRSCELLDKHKVHAKVCQYMSFVHLLHTAFQMAEMKAYIKKRLK